MGRREPRRLIGSEQDKAFAILCLSCINASRLSSSRAHPLHLPLTPCDGYWRSKASTLRACASQSAPARVSQPLPLLTLRSARDLC